MTQERSGEQQSGATRASHSTLGSHAEDVLQVHGGSFCAFYDHSTDVDEGKPETILAAAGAG